jgi:cytochrome P450
MLDPTRHVTTNLQPQYVCGEGDFEYFTISGNSLSFLLYLLAKNPEKQEKLREEINSFGHQKLTTQDIANMKYLKACQQESFRVLPTTNGNLRVLPHDVTIRGYNVPAGTAVFWSTMLTAKNSDMFPDPGISKFLFS